ncbi:hypothetical protein NIE88_04025 [Sporolactobacillus shoreicorticis]|uniref:Secreted protein n=1 Tax=Sporolactobacillus shoreicorticis TaxID=1923877 RepID=A0ABW5RXW1_9BACL|nr:hypothetical protein [Sporolactobacillus shoreicorticis]MCO7124943.1 hypothetical protein [Sporolactobacillus shoreicorticis]
MKILKNIVIVLVLLSIIGYNIPQVHAESEKQPEKPFAITKSASGVTASVERINKGLIQPFAGNGEWNYVTTAKVTYDAFTGWKKQFAPGYVNSNGGDFLITVPQHSINYYNIPGLIPTLNVKLYEYDANNADEFVASWSTNSQASGGLNLIARHLNSFVDGSNKKAEFYVYVSTNYNLVGTSIGNLAFYD